MSSYYSFPKISDLLACAGRYIQAHDKPAPVDAPPQVFMNETTLNHIPFMHNSLASRLLAKIAFYLKQTPPYAAYSSIQKMVTGYIPFEINHVMATICAKYACHFSEKLVASTVNAIFQRCIAEVGACPAIAPAALSWQTVTYWKCPVDM